MENLELLETVVTLLWSLFGFYTAVGLVLLLPVHLRILPHLDDSTAGASWGFRLAVTPGLVFLWPLVIAPRMSSGKKGADSEARFSPLAPRSIRSAQAWITRVLALVIPIIAAFVIAGRPGYSVVAPPALYAGSSPQGVVSPLDGVRLPGLPVHVRAIQEGGDWKLAVTVSEDLHVPAAALYWSDAPEEPLTIDGARALGSIWGPTSAEYRLPGGVPSRGWLILYSAASGEVVSAVAVHLSEGVKVADAAPQSPIEGRI